jgi:dTDP-glucose 4,6-dehydratase
MEKVLITGGAGFFGSHVVQHILKNTDWEVIVLARLNLVGDIQRIIDAVALNDYPNRVRIVYHDLIFDIPEHISDKIGKVDYIVHIAANSHVDRSITSPKEFFQDNVMGSVNLLEWYRKTNPSALFINFLTDEVFGPTPGHYNFKEDDRWRPSNPYSASKAGQGAAGISYHITYKLPIITTYTMNIFGERQHPEKLVAKAIHKINNNEPIKIHSKLDSSGNVEYVGERHWLYAGNAASATLFLLQNGTPGEHYNVVSDTEFTNDELVRRIAKLMNKEARIEYIDFSHARPGHDRRYGLDGSKLRDMGWNPSVSFDDAITNTINWFLK